MLDVARVIRPRDGRFDTVYFFTRDDEAVLETRKNIPGARGFPGDFVKVVLAEDLDENLDVTAIEIPQDQPDIRETRARLLALKTQRDFRRSFPFDVINLDLEGYLFKPTERVPGDLVRALRKGFEWQRRSLVLPNRPPERLDGFGLMFTTKLGPHNLSDEFLEMLAASLDSNLTQDPRLREHLVLRTGIDHIATLLDRNFDAFFKLAAPKVIAEVLWESDWYVDPEHGIDVYAFQRTPPNSPPYTMLHFVMDVRRQNPPIESRPPYQAAEEAAQAYRAVVRTLFDRPATVITIDGVDRDAMEADLDRIEQRRRKYAGATC